MASEQVPYWLLMSVLLSSIPLEPALAMRLYRSAIDLFRANEGRATLAGDLAQGEVRNLKQDLLLGTLGGPGFEARLDTPRGSGTVRFLLTRQGLDLPENHEDGAPAGATSRPGRPRSTMN